MPKTDEAHLALAQLLNVIGWAQPTSTAGGGGPWRLTEHQAYKDARKLINRTS